MNLIDWLNIPFFSDRFSAELLALWIGKDGLVGWNVNWSAFKRLALASLRAGCES
jgi:hypothetical protein